ncbi:glycoside hydrolase [Aspergillus taichungensis]|uniref:beta-N-acetylhexosaminidase n=1 Tax=Aspergillus taichungensis TaxID=482145 RepID=A0A2J5I626_9EURO|nr:glycoside hydrolase [Aspergillus taichungensis]
MRAILAWGLIAAVSALQTLPPVQWEEHGQSFDGFDPARVARDIYISNSFASHRDQTGLTLIPPSAAEFARTFRDDIEEVTGERWRLHAVNELPRDKEGIFLDRSQRRDWTYENGDVTEEGYELEIQAHRVVIEGSGARGMWWATRTLLQEIIIAGKQPIPRGHVIDVPSVPTRGFLLDAGRKWYSPAYLKELCTYASFFKMSEFHYHTSDNYPLSRGHNETWNDVYAQFALHPENPELYAIVQRANETLSRADFEDLQEHCAQRGVTVIPEIEAPGHCLFLTKWKPQLALDKKDLLNLTHPETITTVKQMWEEFLPWFQTKEVHIGADEYDSTLADNYVDFVNEMARFVDEKSGKRVRIWGTYEPTDKPISKDIIIQHWQYGQSDPVLLSNQGYDVINSEDWWAYMSLKNSHVPITPAPYPQLFNNTRVLNFADQSGWQWTPKLFNPVNVTEQPNKPPKGAILAAWNDNGPDATTQLESFYAIRDGIPVVAARAWSGNRGPLLEESSLSESVDLLTSAAVAQNLDRRIKKTAERNYDFVNWRTTNQKVTDRVSLGYGSKGMNYKLDMVVSGPFTLSSDDVTLELSPSGSLTFISDGWPYPLRSVAENDGFDPIELGRIWVNQTSSSHEPVIVPLKSQITIRTDVTGGSRVWVNGKFSGRFEVFVFGGKNMEFSWSQMAFVAPLEWLQGSVHALRHKGEAPPAGWVQPVNNQSASGGYNWGYYVAQKAHVNRYNYAVSGAVCSNKISPRTYAAIDAPFPSVLEYEVPAFLADSKYKAPPSGKKFLDIPADETVYAIWIGTNDLGNYAFITDSQIAGKTIPDYIECVYQALDAVHANGGRYFVLMNLAPLQLAPMYATPEHGGTGPNLFWPEKPDNKTAVSYRMWDQVATVNEVFQYKTAYEAAIGKRYPGAKLATMDVNGLLSDAYNHPEDFFGQGSAVNVTGYNKHCDVKGQNCQNLPHPEQFMWYDELHPSEVTDKVIADEFVKVIRGKSKYATYW